MMTYRMYGVYIVGVIALAGCGPGEPAQTTLVKYQKNLVREGPGRRAGEAVPQGLVRPLGEPGVTELPTRPGTISLLDDKGQIVSRKVTLIDLSLEEVVLRALANSPEIRIASFEPGIARQDVIKAAAAFDPVFFARFGINEEDKRRTVLNSGLPEQIWKREASAGLKEHLPTGADVQLEWGLTRQRTTGSPPFGSTTRPTVIDYEQTLALTIKQPLLRDAGCDVNLATLRVARISRDMSDEAFRDKVEQTVGTVIAGYYALQGARQNVEFQESLLKATDETLQKVKARGQLDSTDVHIKQTEAALESRRASLLGAQKALFDAQDKLARTLDDKKINLVDDYVIIPTTPLTEAPMQVSAADQLSTALKYSPLLAQARMAIQSAGISVDVARNQLLPRLDLSTGATVQGLGKTFHSSGEDLESRGHLGYDVALTLEVPLGNREAEAMLAKSKMQKDKAVATLQDLATQVAAVVRDRVRQVETTYRQFSQQKKAVEALIVQLRAMDLTEQEMGRLTPEWLAVKLQAQESLAGARAAQAQAAVDYNTAIINLAQVTGTVLYLPRLKIALPVASGEARWPGTK
ncbi:MAG: TolC family protein [Planctomycetota bacterium]|nr:TolC family protein [Planctomycetota bacterium]